jgi:hypothetical protein
MNSKRNTLIVVFIAYVVGLFHCRWCWEKELTGRTFVDDIRDSIGSMTSSNKVHWHIRFDTWLGCRVNQLTGCKFKDQIDAWYTKKYPIVEES